MQKKINLQVNTTPTTSNTRRRRLIKIRKRMKKKINMNNYLKIFVVEMWLSRIQFLESVKNY